jgi:hypothetical protein
MSLQFQNVRFQFVQDCVQLWRTWLTCGGSAAVRTQNRQVRIRTAINRMTGFMLAPTVTFPAMSDWGSFSRLSWTLKITGTHTARDAVTYKNFVDLCATAYHETRHGEQWYRVAQALASGRIEFPDKSGFSKVQEMTSSGVGGSSVSDRVRAFEGKSFAGQQDVRKALIAKWMGIPARVVDHAVIHQAYFDNFASSSVPAWFRRNTVVAEVDDWMRTRYKMTQNELTSFLQGDDGPFKMYKSLATEHDAFGIEQAVMTAIKQAIGHDNPTDLARQRTDAGTFGP